MDFAAAAEKAKVVVKRAALVARNVQVGENQRLLHRNCFLKDVVL